MTPTTEMTRATASTASADPASPVAAGPLAALVPLAVDVALPLGGYYLLHKGLGLGLVDSLALSSAPPAIRMVYIAVRDRAFNGLAGLMLAVNAVSLLLSFVSGNARLLVAKDSGVSSVIALSIIGSVFAGRPLMSAGLKPFLTRGDAARTAAWDRLAAESARFRRLERRYSLIWGAALLSECLARVAGAFALPAATMVWLSTVLLVGAIVVAMLVSGAAAAGPIERMVRAQAEAGTREVAPAGNPARAEAADARADDGRIRACGGGCRRSSADRHRSRRRRHPGPR